VSGGFSIDRLLEAIIWRKNRKFCYINLRHYSGTVVAISTAGAFAYEVTRETTDLVTITDLMLKTDLTI
jgi:hypothetical protein